MKREPVYVLDRVCFKYTTHTVLNDISFSTGRGELTAICGPNGVGKSTLIRLMCGLRLPAGGSLTLYGRVVDINRIGFIGQYIDPSWPLSVYDTVSLGLYRRSSWLGPLEHKARDIIMARLKETDLLHLKHRPILEISSGERQRVYLAMVLVRQPEILLLDEPVSHLDLKHRKKFMVLLKNLASQGISVICVVHDINLASYFADRVVLLKDGALFCQGAPAEVLTCANLEAVYDTPVWPLNYQRLPEKQFFF